MRMTSDPRNIGDKSFMHNSLKILIEYLSNHGYDHPISLKILTRPAVKDFSNIINFLFHQIDPNFKGTGKFEDDVVTWFKFLGYPFQIAKSHITAVGSPHAWPSLLASLIWLIELLQYDELSGNNQSPFAEEFTGIDDPESSDKAFYNYLAHGYKLFLSGQDDKYDALSEKFKEYFENQKILIQDQISAYEQRNRMLSSEIADCDKRRAYLPELEAKKKDYLNDLGKFEVLIEQLLKHKEQLKTKTESRSNDIIKLNNAITVLQQENNLLKQRIETQELTPEDVRNMISERERLEEAQQIASEQRQQIQRKVWETETALRDKVQALEDSARAYNSVAEDLKLIPLTARNSRGKNLAIEVDVRTKKRNTLVKSDIRNEILPYLSELKYELIESTRKLHHEFNQEQDIVEECDLRYNDLKQQYDHNEMKLRRVEESYRREKELLDQASEGYSRRIDEMEVQLVQVRDCSLEETKCSNALRKTTEIKATREYRKVEHEKMKRELMNGILDVVTLAANHREAVQQSLLHVKDQYTQHLSDFVQQNSTIDETQGICKQLFA